MTKLKKLKCFVAGLLAATMMGQAAIPAMAAQEMTLKFLTATEYDNLYAPSDGMILAQKGETYQYLDLTGKVVIDNVTVSRYFGVDTPWDYDPEGMGYDGGAGAFHEGYAVLWYQEDSVFIDKTGKVVFDNRASGTIAGGDYTSGKLAGDFSDGIAFVWDRPVDPAYQIYTLTKNGVMMSIELYDKYEQHYYMNDHFSDGLIAFHEIEYYDGQSFYYNYGFMDKNFNIVIPGQFDRAYPFNDGLALAAADWKYGFIDKTGKFAIEPIYDAAIFNSSYDYKSFADGLAPVAIENSNGELEYGYIDKTGKTVVPFQFEYAGTFKNGYALVVKNGKYGIMNKSGALVLPTTYDDANYFQDGYTLVKSGGLHKIVDTKGNSASTDTFLFESVNSSGDGVFNVKQKGKWALAKIEPKTTPTTADVTVIFNGETIPLNLPVLYNNGRTFYPFRECLEAMGASINWDAEARTASGTLGSKSVGFIVNSNLYTENGTQVSMEGGQMTFMINNRTYIPIRYAAEALGFTVEWDNATQTITITDPASAR